MQERRILPFYMTYPLPMYYQEEDSTWKRYQKVITGILDTLDYSDSMIYDEYPDKWQLYKLSMDIADRIKREDIKNNPDAVFPEEKWKWLGDLVQILVCYEIYRRRHNSRRGVLRF